MLQLVSRVPRLKGAKRIQEAKRAEKCDEGANDCKVGFEPSI
jgi:hypothetical protein